MTMDKWETVTETTQRMMVPSGWLVRSIISKNAHTLDGFSVSVGVAMVFLPDPNREWLIKVVSEV